MKRVCRQWHCVQNLLDALSFSEGFCRTAPQFKSHEVPPEGLALLCNFSSSPALAGRWLTRGAFGGGANSDKQFAPTSNFGGWNDRNTLQNV